ncbi:MAG: hypothetical protein JWO46_1788 [Nocardioidaceae bacterium]|nr:hypothetical protein [Nocardioidaceae bacterium]
MSTPVVDVGGRGYLTLAHGCRDGALALLGVLALAALDWALNGTTHPKENRSWLD